MTKIRTLLVCLLVTAIVFAAGLGRVVQAEDNYHLGITTKQVINVWEAFFQESFRWYNEDLGYNYTAMEARGDPSLQITQARRLVDMGVDGLIIAAQEAITLRPAVDYATENNVPVITTDADVDHEDVAMYVGFSGVRAGESLSEEIVKYLRENVEPEGEVAGTVLELRGPIGGASADDRHMGFRNVMEDYPEVEIIEIVADFKRGPAKTESERILHAREIDAIYGANGPMAEGALEAIKDLGEDPEDYFIATMDAMPTVLEAIGRGEIDVAFDQPCQFYNPIAIHYLTKILEEGEDALPEPGDVVTTDDLTIEGSERHGVDVWAHDEMWAPAQITTTLEESPERYEHDHLWFMTDGILVTEENYDWEALWGNLDLPGW